MNDDSKQFKCQTAKPSKETEKLLIRPMEIPQPLRIRLESDNVDPNMTISQKNKQTKNADLPKKTFSADTVHPAKVKRLKSLAFTNPIPF